MIGVLALGPQAAGMYQSRSRAAYYDGRNQIGEPVASEVYCYSPLAISLLRGKRRGVFYVKRDRKIGV